MSHETLSDVCEGRTVEYVSDFREEDGEFALCNVAVYCTNGFVVDYAVRF